MDRVFQRVMAQKKLRTNTSGSHVASNPQGLPFCLQSHLLFHFILCSLYKNKICKKIKAFICSTHRFLRHLGPGNSPQQHHVHCYSQHRCRKGTGRQHQQHKQDSKTIFYLNSIFYTSLKIMATYNMICKDHRCISKIIFTFILC